MGGRAHRNTIDPNHIGWQPYVGIFALVTCLPENRPGIRGADRLLEAAVAMKLEATLGEISSTIHSHPSLFEALVEAAPDVTGETLRFLSPGRQT